MPTSGEAEERLANDPTSELWGEHRGRYRFAADGVGGLRVLDLACGAGFGLSILRAAGAHAVGMDLEWAALVEAKRFGEGAPLSQADAACLPLPDASLDLVVSFETVEHVPDAAAAIAEFARVLRPGGRLVLSTPNRAFGPPGLHTRNPFHVRELTGGELRELLGERFEAVELHGQHVDPSYRFVPFLMVERDLSPSAVAWKVVNRLPGRVKDRLARLLSGRPFYPTEMDYRFPRDRWHDAHTLVAVASRPRTGR